MNSFNDIFTSLIAFALTHLKMESTLREEILADGQYPPNQTQLGSGIKFDYAGVNFGGLNNLSA